MPARPRSSPSNSSPQPPGSTTRACAPEAMSPSPRVTTPTAAASAKTAGRGRASLPISASRAPPPVATATTRSVRPTGAPTTSVPQCAVPYAPSAAKTASRTASESRVGADSRATAGIAAPGPAGAGAGRARSPLTRPPSEARAPEWAWDERGADSRGHPPAGTVQQAAGAAGDLEGGGHARQRIGDDDVASARRHALQRAGRLAEVGDRHPEHRARPRPQRAGRRGWALLDQRQPDVHAAPSAHVVSDLDRAAVARQEDRAAAVPGQPDAQRPRRSHRLVQRLLARRGGRVEKDERRRVELSDEPALEHLAATGDGRPVDARGGGAVPVGAQAVDLELGSGGVELAPGEPMLGAERAALAHTGAAPARSGHRRDPRQHQHLLPTRSHQLAHVQPERIADDEHVRVEDAAPAA